MAKSGITLNGRELLVHELADLTEAERFCAAEETSLVLEKAGMSMENAFYFARQMTVSTKKPDRDAQAKWKRDLGL